MTIEEEVEALIVKNQFMNDNFSSNSTAVLDEDTDLDDELCSHRTITADFYVCV